ncbi:MULTISPECIES: methionyl-tRNA formyltransferase [unclassified Granulicatella]|uniref:methionyl-tRNA formyltransferase n=1 Tax=unclassified Granulicatella TaxID=2630493 RepID=UPI00107408A5|nr:MULTISPECIES: methionyl-tRNA formyltransferase [unclassified Granulicatella]MBF0780655.1 methionyl-tRNA formyltransferase [Granulicatella sp. 19428wC4_WM01]TFU94556.1 methionyl-tRNA formyltransferase [Granulicatella sp. WM01]
MTKNILFMGTPDFAVPVLQSLINSEYHVIGVVTQPDRPVGRKKILTPSPVKVEALKHHIPVFQPEKLSASPELEQLLTLNIDLIVTAAYGQFLPSCLLNHPTHRSINVHASLLPKYRGGAPIQYALMNGDEQTGVSIMYMEKKMDAGDILAQKAIPILETDTVSTLFDKLSQLGSLLLIETLPKLFARQIEAIPQDERLVTFSPALKREEELMDWHQTAQQLNWKIRAMNAWPGAYTYLNGERFKIWEAVPVLDIKDHDKTVGTVLSCNHELYVACGHGTVLSLREVQPAGKAKMSIQQYLNGAGKQLQEGVQFGN